MYCELTLFRQSQIQKLIETASATECQKDVNSRSQRRFNAHCVQTHFPLQAQFSQRPIKRRLLAKIVNHSTHSPYN